MTEQQAQNIIAFLELARTAIDNAELRIVGLTDEGVSRNPLLCAVSDMHAAAANLYQAIDSIKVYGESVGEIRKDASAAHRVTP